MKYLNAVKVAYCTDYSINMAEQLLIDTGSDYFDQFMDHAPDFYTIRCDKLISEIMSLDDISISHYKLIQLLCNEAIKQKEGFDKIKVIDEENKEDEFASVREIINCFINDLNTWNKTQRDTLNIHKRLEEFLNKDIASEYVKSLTESDEHFQFIKYFTEVWSGKS